MSLSYGLEGLALGLAVGSGYFYCLWLTVKKLVDHKHPMRLVAISFICRLGFALSVFYLTVSDGNYLRLVSAIIGFLIARELLKKLIGNVPIITPCP